MSLNVKKIAAVALVVMMGVGVAFAGDIAISIDARANLYTDKGFTITGGDDYLGQLLASYTAEKGGGFLRMRMNTRGQAPAVDRWNAWIKPFDFLKLTLTTAPYEVYAESIRWEPIFAAGLFESGNPNFVVEIMPMDALTIMVGVDAGLSDAKKPWNTMAAAVKYNIANIGSVAAEFAMIPKFNEVQTSIPGVDPVVYAVTLDDGQAKKFGAQFEFAMVPNLAVLIGYTGIVVDQDGVDAINALVASGDTEVGGFAQNRFEIFATYGMDKFAVALYDAFILRSAGYGDFGNRVALKASYQINDAFNVWLKIEHFMNYGGSVGAIVAAENDSAGLAWAAPQLFGPGNSLNDQADMVSALVIEPRVEWNLGNGIGSYLGVKLAYDIDDSYLSYWIPLGITVNF